MNLLVVDNYDSFTYNLVAYLRELLGKEVTVRRNDAINLPEVANYDAIVLSPGPGLPAEAGIMPDLIQNYADKKAILGVCLGHQAIGEAFGGKLYNLDQVYHGLATQVEVTDSEDALFVGLPNTFTAGRYHSWVIDPATMPECLQTTAIAENGNIMALRHKQYPIYGVQFHPESIMTKLGKNILDNFLSHAAAQ